MLYISLPVVIGCAIWQARSIKVGWTACNLAVSMNNKKEFFTVRQWYLSLKILIYSSEGFWAEFWVDLKIFSEERFCPTSPHSTVLIWKTFTSSCTYICSIRQTMCKKLRTKKLYCQRTPCTFFLSVLVYGLCVHRKD